MKIEKRTIHSEHIVIPAKEISFLGPELCLEDCTIEIKCAAKDLAIAGFTMHNGVFYANKDLSNIQIKNSNFTGVSFKGVFSGVDFGVNGEINECDFSTSILDNCRFIGVDLTSIKLPANDHIVFTPKVIELMTNELRKIPSKLSLFVRVISKNQPYDTTAIVANIPRLAKKLKVDGSEVDLLKEYALA